MNAKLFELREQVFKARLKLAEDLQAVDQVRVLLLQADERRNTEPVEARKWNRVLENLENSLDQTRARHAYSQAVLFQLEQALLELEHAAGQSQIELPEPPRAEKAEQWTATLEKVGAMSLEEACVLQSQIDSGEIHDAALEAGLELTNQMHPDVELAGSERIPDSRRQVVLRAAIDKVGKQAFDSMTLDEIKLLMACHSLLTSRLEPTMRDQRLKRILDGAIKILQKKKDAMEGL